MISLLAAAPEIDATDDWVRWVVAGSIVIATLAISTIVRRVVVNGLDKGGADPHTARLVGNMLRIGLVALALVVALGVLQASGLSTLLGALGVTGIALAVALREVLENLIAGIFILTTRPFRVGETLATTGYEGVVQDVSLRAVALLTFEGERVVIPSATVLKNPYINYSRIGTRRAAVAIRVPVTTDVDAAKDTIVERVRTLPSIVSDPDPVVVVTGFVDAGMELSVRAWFDTNESDRLTVVDAVARAARDALVDKGIDVA